ncbi:hypothetical protein PFICI_12673 [Pestalotiopsis fici W106-1]|uniref:WSC domain-containing protein n=1 Tax=Pestalotiopsis fici (strain W106-1 / CGMCC3.15140) TaxID=1229662 RepID=W3WPM1_PESFW|nr:uncharacterized protein PFICI_12673 [Pestalotiopsis fici W106-1]ETS75729.1 hypothetical protein PFICI_12673 [Pestalotiopsis fici W106-1]
MKSIFCLLPLAVAVLASSGAEETAAEDPIKGTDTVHGCYSSVGELTFNSTNAFNGQGLCSTYCRGGGFAVAASQSSDCYCGDKYPPESTLVDDSECNEPCPGFSVDACGGADTYTVYNTGEKVNVDSSSDDSTSSSASASGSTTINTAASTAVSTGTSAAATTTGSASNGTATTGTTTSTSATTVITNAAVAQLPVLGLNLAVLGLGAAALVL